MKLPTTVVPLRGAPRTKSSTLIDTPFRKHLRLNRGFSTGATLFARRPPIVLGCASILAVLMLVYACVPAIGDTKNGGHHLFRTASSQCQQLQASLQNEAMVQAQVKDKTLWFVLDTGSTGLFFDQYAVDAVGLTSSISKSMVTTDVSLGDYQARNARFWILPDRRRDNDHDVAGVIGAPLFRSSIVTIDYRANSVSLCPRDNFSPSAAVGGPYGLSFYHGLPVVTTSWGGVSTQMVLDTGASQTILFKGTADRAAITETDVSGEVAIGYGKQSSELHQYVMKPFVWGRLRVERPVVFVADDNSTDLSEAGIGGIVGRDVLRHLAITIDYDARQIYF